LRRAAAPYALAQEENAMTILMTPACLNALGQGTALIGVFILFRFAMPFQVRLGGAEILTTHPTEENIEKENLYWWLGMAGLALVLVGGAIQIVANFWPAT
jgi:hypothetical protein